jgi:dipeptidyl aminopeptidase/acylaminoacyl peptidase
MQEMTQNRLCCLKDKISWNAVYGPGRVDEVLMSDDQRLVVYKKSRFNEPPAVFALDLVSKETRLLYQSNEELLDYDLGRDELLAFNTGKKGSLSGALIYPAFLNPDDRMDLRKELKIGKFFCTSIRLRRCRV